MRRASLDGGDHRRQTIGKSRASRGSAAAAKAARARCASPAASSSAVKVSAMPPPELRDRGGILAIERMGEGGAAIAGGALCVEKKRRHGWHGEVEADLGQSHRRQGIGARQHDLRVRLRCVGADKLDPRLCHLPVRGEMVAAHAEALAGIG